ncbi:M4 family metallopeptidase [Paucibacter sp. DJ1R-11]|uniref:M4 family metallopeptidase n=1 Tax=Paucibacter sp. DJ1R-11 TaxID=2893556 RepID=UPI0021E44291|nr:M4 family metallopeptidase [Paucibacter sp. DJ1R-11]MCV2363180.1 M4 family metallopeptidase [Paucibacter sp. DJ1R-11]
MIRNQLKLSMLALSVGMALASQAQAQGALNGQREAASRLASATGSSAEVSYHAATGSARFVRVPVGARLAARAGAVSDAAKQAAAVQFMSDYAGLFGISNAAAELAPATIEKDRQGGTHLTHRQIYQGLPVFGAELKSHFDAAGNLVVVNGNFIPDITVSASPSRNAAQASQIAVARVTADQGRAVKLSASTPALMIFREGLAKGVAGANHLAWQVEVGNRADVREFVYVDAHTGKVIDTISGIHEGLNRRAFDGQGKLPPVPNYPNTPFWVEGQAFPTGTTEADNMIAASSDIYNLFKNAFGRDSFDGKGKTMDSIFNRGDACPNASWNGTYISFCPGTTTDDVTAHEWGHAYTEYTHGLIYQYQSGALNEAYSDIWGETVDRINGRGGDTPDATRTNGSCTVSTKVAQTIINAPAAIAGVKTTGTAAFGPQTFPALSGEVVGVDVGSTSAGCTAPLAANVSGKIAFIDRGTCGYAVKVKNAQLAGAIGVIVGNNTGGTAIVNMGGADASITIPSLSVSQNDGSAIKGQLAAGVNATLVRGPGADNSVRWLMGEDSTAFGGAIRDMYNPTCYGNPGKVSDAQYACSSADNGGVHGNSGVPNHGYALLVDGGNYNGQNVLSIGLTKAAHIYYRAQSVYQGPASNFVDHADALQQSCSDLTGVNLASLTTGAASGEIITASDCAQVGKVVTAIELRTPPTQCNFQPLLAKSPPALCAVGSPTALLTDSFDGGKRAGVRWSVSYAGSNPEFTPRTWGVVNGLPGGRAGYALFAGNPNIGSCAAGSNQAGLQRVESPEFTIPADVTEPKLTFDHYVATEASYDGGNVKISVNGGAWQLVPATAFIYNAYNATMAAAPGNDSPLAGQPGFTGTDGGSLQGSWGRSIVNLSSLAKPNDKVKLRFEAGNDGCGGVKGWYLDDVTVYRCTP